MGTFPKHPDNGGGDILFSTILGGFVPIQNKLQGYILSSTILGVDVEMLAIFEGGRGD